jgi:predicted  nucleic acid-binding Zn-ribbon protein
MPTTGANGDWIRTMIGALSAIVVTMGSLYSVVIIPQSTRIEKLEVGRESDSKQLALLYTSIQTNDEYKKTIVTELAWVRSDIVKIRERVERAEEEQKRRAVAVASVGTLEARMDRLDRRNEEQDRRSAPTILDEVKALRAELESLRQRIMVPVTAAPK